MRTCSMLLALLCVLPAAAAAQGAAPAPAEARALAAALGYPEPDYAVVLSWSERAPRVHGAFVTGLRLHAQAGGAPFDVYAVEGLRADAALLEALGIAPKPLEAGGATQPGAAAPAAAAAMAAAAPPAPPVPSATAGVMPPDLAALAAEDAKAVFDPEKAGERMGVFAGIGAPIAVADGVPTLGAWAPAPGAPGAMAWCVAVYAPGALGLRLRVTRLGLPAGGALRVYAPAAGAAYGPYAAIDLESGELWTPTCFGDTALIEVRVANAADRAAVQFALGDAAYRYRDPAAEKAAGACNIDAACHPDWNAPARAVCGLGTIVFGGEIFCTGTLIDDTNPCTAANLVLTANHCVGAQTGTRGASSLEFYWLYQTAACNAAPPALSSVPRTPGGADLLATSVGRGDTGGGTDVTLVRMRNAPPLSIPTAGWAAIAPPVGTLVTGIHHPRGDFKRISFGAKSSVANAFPGLFHETVWSSGTTEPASSGSPLFDTASQRIIGQLWGGAASCSNPTAPDYYGRFDVSYPLLAPHLDPGPIEAGMASTALTVGEGAGNAIIDVLLDLPSAGTVALAYESAAGAAAEGADFTAVQGTLNYPVFARSAAISVPIVDDTHTEPDETFTVTLAGPACCEIAPARASITVTIEDDDADTDGDGISDADEAGGFYGPPTDPALADTDGDGLDDAAELFDRYGYDTDPVESDTDGDGVADYHEIVLGLDPTDPLDAAGLSSIALPWFR